MEYFIIGIHFKQFMGNLGNTEQVELSQHLLYGLGVKLETHHFLCGFLLVSPIHGYMDSGWERGVIYREQMCMCTYRLLSTSNTSPWKSKCPPELQLPKG